MLHLAFVNLCAFSGSVLRVSISIWTRGSRRISLISGFARISCIRRSSSAVACFGFVLLRTWSSLAALLSCTYITFFIRCRCEEKGTDQFSMQSWSIYHDNMLTLTSPVVFCDFDVLSWISAKELKWPPVTITKGFLVVLFKCYNYFHANRNLLTHKTTKRLKELHHGFVVHIFLERSFRVSLELGNCCHKTGICQMLG